MLLLLAFQVHYSNCQLSIDLKKRCEEFPTRAASDIPKVFYVSRSIKLTGDDISPKSIEMYSRQEGNGWRIKYMSFEMQDDFMASNFINTTLLWAYQRLNIGAAKADLYRLAQLILTGGVYADYDAYIHTPFDEIISRENSTLILTLERPKNKLFNCFDDTYRLSTNSLRARFGDRYDALMQKWPKSTFTNWFMFAVPGHPLLYSALEEAVELVFLEFSRKSVLTDSVYGESTNHHNDRFHQVLCTTGPYSLSKIIIESFLIRNLTSTSESKGLLSVAESDFRIYGGIPKLDVYFTKNDPSYFTFGMRNLSQRLLTDYGPLPHTALEDVCITTFAKTEFFVFHSGSLHPFRDWDQFKSSGLNRRLCSALHRDDIRQLPHGATLTDSYDFSKTRSPRPRSFSARRAGLV